MTAAALQPPPQALRGVRVLDFSHVIAGPFATFHLAQLGAEVTKVEKPGGGDVMRRTAAGARAFTALNAGKRMRAIDIASAAGRAEVLALAREADVIVDNYRPGVLRRHGLGYDDIHAVNPRIIYCAISGYGYSDPARTSHGAYDHVIQALTGMTMLAGTEGDPPVKTGFPVVDAATGIIGALAIVVALRERDRTGEGSLPRRQHVGERAATHVSVRVRDAHVRQRDPAHRQQGLLGQPGRRHLRLVATAGSPSVPTRRSRSRA